MIIKTEESNVTVVGDIQENKVSIDPNNLEYITTLLSSNLYSNPEESFIREIVSNAWDSHVEAGNTDKAVIISIENGWISIRDFGTGLSPERFKEIYMNIGSSTKRNTNNFIGGFGIGRMSAMACTNICHITSYYEGKEYKYIMIKDGNNININLMLTSDTEEPNGLNVSIQVKDEYRYIHSLRKIQFFPNIYCKCNHFIACNINRNKIKKYSNFAISECEIGFQYALLLGNVLYPLDTSILSASIRQLYQYIYTSHDNFALTFNVGDLTVTPNRENILYSNSTINKIQDKIKSAAEELLDLFQNETLDNYTDILALSSHFDFKLKDSNNSNLAIYLRIGSILSLYSYFNRKLPTYKGNDISCENMKTMDYYCSSLQSREYPNISCIFVNGTFYSRSSQLWKVQKYKRAGQTVTNNIIIVPKGTVISSYFKEWIRSKFDDAIILYEIDYSEFSKGFQYAYANGYMYHEDIVKAIYNKMHKKGIRINPESHTEFLKFKEDLKQERKKQKKESQEDPKLKDTINISYYINDYTYARKKTDTVDNLIKFFNKDRANKGCIVTNHKNEFFNVILNIAKIKKYDVIAVPKNFISYFKSIKGYIDADSVLVFSNNLIQSLYTISNLGIVGTARISYLWRYFDSINYDIYREYKYYEDILNNYPDLRSYIRSIPTGRPYNKYAQYLHDKTTKLADIYSDIVSDARSIGIDVHGLAFSYFLMKKKIRIPYKIYKEYLDSGIKTKKYIL